MKRYAVIVAGGSGSRMKTEIPKQFLELRGKPVLMHTLQRFRDFDPALSLVLVLPAHHTETWKELCEKHAFSLEHELVNGGETRFHSVKNGILSIKDTEAVVGIHDGVRPLVSLATLKRCYEGAEQTGNAIPAVAVTDSIRKVEHGTNQYLNRDEIRVIQTPQCFHLFMLKKAFQQEYSPSFTDDATVVENTGISIHLVDGNPENIKITTPQDLKIAELILQEQ